jgi:ABC-type sugar transport system substrate-binding protein
MKRTTARFALLSAALVAACSHVTPAEVADVKEADASMVAQCQFLGTVDTVATVQTELTQDAFMARVRNEVKLKAKNLGGDTIVFNDSVTVKPVHMSGKAYRCGAK